ncbi:hypothetical protein ABZW03_37510, partial [Kitasatospora sp. NPDC004799]
MSLDLDRAPEAPAVNGAAAVIGTPPDHEQYLWERLHRVEQRVRAAVRARRADDPDPDDPYRGQYLGPEAVDRILAASATVHRGTADPGDGPAPPPGSRLGRLSAAFGLLPVDLDLLLIALAPDLDARFEQLYGYLNDDLTRRRATVGLALELCGLPGAGAGRFRFSTRAPLIAGGLLEVAEPDRPLLSRTLRVPDRVTAHLLGDDEPDGALAGLARRAAPGSRGFDSPASDEGPAERLRALAAHGGLVHLVARGGAGGVDHPA